MTIQRLLLVGIVLSISGAHAAEKVAVAAAANLVFALEAIHAEFQRAAPGVVLTTATGSSGSLYAQIQHGAPFDVFLSADVEYPQQMVAAQLADAASLRVFATGRLVIWTTKSNLDLSDWPTAIGTPAVKRIAIAQPRTAPYGRAARATLEARGVWSVAERKLVIGESISQAAQFVETGNAEIGLVAMSLVLSPRLKTKGKWQEIAPEHYASVSLEQAGVLTRRGAANPAAQRYLDFLASPPAREILRTYGYALPPERPLPTDALRARAK